MLFRQQYKKPIPSFAKITAKADGTHTATWRSGGTRYTGIVKTDAKGQDYITAKSAVWHASYVDSAHKRVVRSTGCRERGAAEAVLNRWRGITEKVKAGQLRPTEEHAPKGKPRSYADAQREYLDALTKGWVRPGSKRKAHPASKSHLYFVGRTLTQFAEQQHPPRPIDITTVMIQRFLDGITGQGLSVRSHDYARAALSGFMQYCVCRGWMPDNPVGNTQALETENASDKRRQPRVLSDDELARLLNAAERRPLENFLAGGAQPKPATLEALRLRGRMQRLIYAVLLSTGLRWGELRAVRVRDVVLDQNPPHIRLSASFTKNRQDGTQPLAQATADVADWIQTTGRELDAPLFNMNASGLREFDKDLAAAGIPKRTHKGIACVHGLRHCLGTRLARAGVPVAIARDIMRHSDVKTTLRFYTHLTLIDHAAALEKLPSLELDMGGKERASQTG